MALRRSLRGWLLGWLLGWAGLFLFTIATVLATNGVAVASSLDEAGLFNSATLANTSAAAPEGSLRHRFVQPVFERLRSATVESSDTIAFNLFDDLQVCGQVTRHTVHRNGTETWSGSLEGYPGSRFDIAVKDNSLVGSVCMNSERIFEIRPVASADTEQVSVHVISEQPFEIKPDAPAITTSEDNTTKASAPTTPTATTAQTATSGQFTGCDDPTQIDVMIVYTPAARDTQGGTAAIEALAQLAVDKANEAYANSLIDLELRLVHVAEVAYDESTAMTYSDHLSRLRLKDDGYMDEVHGLRNLYSADLVSLMIWDDIPYWGLGYSGLLDEGYAFSYVQSSVIASSHTFTHEVSHNFGCAHDRANATSAPREPYGYGLAFEGASGTTYGTIMSYVGVAIPYLSNPNVLYEATPTGVPLSDPEPAYNALMITNARQTVANYRIGSPDCNGNGIADTDDISQGTSFDVNNNGLPDECEQRLYVNSSAPDGGDGESWATARNDLSQALEDVTPCSYITEVWVAAGEYKPASPNGDRNKSFALPEGVAIHGGFTGHEASLSERDWVANPTILSGDLNGDDQADFVNYEDNSCQVVEILGSEIHTALDGFTIRGGNADSTMCSSSYGGGIRVSASKATIQHCFIEKCQASHSGGGMEITNGLPGGLIKNCSFRQNHAVNYGGALRSYGPAPDLQDCLFDENESGLEGGALYFTFVAAAPRVQRCIFTGNFSGNNGGAFSLYQSSADLAECDFTRNTADSRGGGISLTASNIQIGNSTFCGNSGGYGGAIELYADSDTLSTTVSNTVFTGNYSTNSGGACSNSYADIEFFGCAWVANETSGVLSTAVYSSADSSTTIANSVMWGHRYPQYAIYGGNTPAVVTYSDIQNGYTGAGNINADPLFARMPSPGPDETWGTTDDDYGDLTLQTGSPCIDAGNIPSIPADALDLDNDGDTTEPTPFDLAGDRRVYDSSVDMGAYEYRDMTIDTDYDDDGDVDEDDVDAFALCGSGPDVPLTIGCEQADLDFDNDVDQADFGIFQRCISGRDIPADSACVK